MFSDTVENMILKFCQKLKFSYDDDKLQKVSPCIMCVQYIRGYSVHRGIP